MPATRSQERRLRQRAEARRAILDATESLLVEEGYESLSMRRLAERCGYTAPTIYHYFGDKRGLIEALLEERFAGLLRHLRRVRRPADPAEHMRNLARAFVRFGLRNPTFYRLLTTPRPASQPDEPPPRPAEEARTLLEAPMQELAASGRLTTPDVETALQSLWALLHGLISLPTSRPDYAWSKDLLEVALETLFRGMVRPAEPALQEARQVSGR